MAIAVSSIKREKFLLRIFLFVLLIQAAFWVSVKEYRPNMAIVPDVPTENGVKAASLGDEQLYFRILAFRLQNAGDTFGRVTPLKDYDFVELKRWFDLLDTLDSQSSFVPSLAGYYFGQTQYHPDARYVVDYLDSYASRDINKNWWWLGQAVYIANHKLEDKARALELAYKLASAQGEHIPLWTKQMPAFIHEQMGEKEAAYFIIKSLLDEKDKLSEGDINFMHYFIKDRLEYLGAE